MILTIIFTFLITAWSLIGSDASFWQSWGKGFWSNVAYGPLHWAAIIHDLFIK